MLQRKYPIALCMGFTMIAGCGGGGGGGGGSTPPPPDPGTPPPSAENCTTPVISAPASGFSQTTAALGLCYEVTDTEPATEMQIMGGGLALGDVNNDGFVDLYVSHGIGEKGRLFLFDGTSFSAAPNNNGIEPASIDNSGFFVDLDDDGWLDFLSIQYEDNGVQVFMNDGTGQFAPDGGITGINVAKTTFSAAATDFDLDGDVDMFFSHWGLAWTGNLSGYLWENDGSGTFSDVSTNVQILPAPAPPPNEDALLEYSFTPIFTHIDTDRLPDLLLAADYESSQVLINSGGSSFIDMTGPAITDENGMGASVADYDNDGDMDWFVTSIHFRGRDPRYDGGVTGNRLYRNDGFGVFEDVTDEAGVREGGWGWGSCFADFNNDGNVDIFHTNGMRTLNANDGDTSHPMYSFFYDDSRLFMSRGDGTFLEQADVYGINHDDQGRGVVCYDYDGDGRVDIFVATNGNSPTVYRNQVATSNHYLQVDLDGPAGNRLGIGARVQVDTASGSYIQDVLLGSNYLSQQPTTLHFGLGVADVVSSVTVTWPDAAGTQTTVTNLAADQRITISWN